MLIFTRSGKWMRAVLVGMGLACLLGAAQAQCMRQSPAHAVALVELYTSEGCDTCPPADRWLGTLGREAAPNSAIPLALHVDYWDQLGWKDRFADARYSSRQRELTRLGRGRVVYTPGVFLNLREFRNWSGPDDFHKAVREINARPAQAVIRLAIKPRKDGRFELEARFELASTNAAARPQAYVAVYENGLETAVKAGENRGVTLRHEQVVRLWLGPIEFSAGKAALSKTLAVDPQWRRAQLGVAAFVQDADRLDVLQATALALCS